MGSVRAMALFVLVAAVGLSSAASVARAQAPATVSALPDNPCALVTLTELRSVTGLDVTEVRRVPSISKIVAAQRAGAEPGAGRICGYETQSRFGAITVHIPAAADRGAARYWEERRRYFETYRGSGQPIRDLAVDAWLAGGARLSVLTDRNEYFTLQTQFYQRESGELLVRLAQAIAGNR